MYFTRQVKPSEILTVAELKVPFLTFQAHTGDNGYRLATQWGAATVSQTCHPHNLPFLMGLLRDTGIKQAGLSFPSNVPIRSGNLWAKIAYHKPRAMLSCVVTVHAKISRLIYYKASLVHLEPEKKWQEMYAEKKNYFEEMKIKAKTSRSMRSFLVKCISL